MAAVCHGLWLQHREPGRKQTVAERHVRVPQRALSMRRLMMTILRTGVARRAAAMVADCRAIAATEFAVIVPIMLVMLFGTIEFSSGVAVDRKVTLAARTLSDLTSQSPPSSPNSVKSTVDDSYLQNVFTASIAILQPYSSTPVRAQLSEIYVDSNQVARIQWSKAGTIGTGATQATLASSTRNPGDIVAVPPTLLVRQTCELSLRTHDRLRDGPVRRELE